MHRLDKSLLIFFLIAASVLRPAAGEEHWFTIRLDGRKIGSAHHERLIEQDGAIRSRQQMELAIERNGVRIGVSTREESVEAADGRPIALSGETAFGGQSLRRYQGEIDAGVLRVRLSGPAGESRREVPWPERAMLSEGLRKTLSRLQPGQKAEASLFVGDLLETVPVRFRAIARETVELPELGPVALLRVEQEAELPGQRVVSTLWIDERGIARKMSMPLLGSRIEMLACSRACAEAPSEVSGIFERSLAAAPAGTARLDRRRPWIYRIRPLDGGELSLPSSAGQLAKWVDGEWIVEVRPGASNAGEAPPGPEFLAPNRWIESDHEEIRRFAQRAIGKARRPAEQMRALEAAVAAHIREKSLAVGYASALETLRSRSGDCTEHALLLAAAGRALGVPTRVATGLVFSPAFGEAREVFVPHAWTQAWIDGHWLNFDAAQKGFGGGHLLLGVGDGDPWRFAEGIHQLGRLEIVEVQMEAAREESQ